MTSSSVPTDVADLNRQWAEAFNAGNLSRLMEFYEPDAVLVPGPGAQPVRGLRAIEASLRWFLALGGQFSFTPRHWLVHGPRPRQHRLRHERRPRRRRQPRRAARHHQ